MHATVWLLGGGMLSRLASKKLDKLSMIEAYKSS